VELRIVSDEEIAPGTDRLIEAQRLVRAVRERLGALDERVADLRRTLERAVAATTREPRLDSSGAPASDRANRDVP
jgi:hypothetical protein